MEIKKFDAEAARAEMRRKREREAKAIVPVVKVVDCRQAPKMKMYDVYSELENKEKHIGFNLTVDHAEYVVRAARRKLIKTGARTEDGKSLFEITEFHIREAI